MEGKGPSGSAIRVLETPEECLGPCAFVCKWEGIQKAGCAIGERTEVLLRLELSTAKGGTFRLGLDDTSNFPVNEQEVVCKTG